MAYFHTNATVDYNSNPPSSTGITETTVHEEFSYEMNQTSTTVTFASPGNELVVDLAAYAYEFVEWNTQRDGSGTTYLPGGTTTAGMNDYRYTVYAIWEKSEEYCTSAAALKAVADAIRTKGGTSESLEFPEGFVEAIEDISTGPGTDVSDTTATASDVIEGKYFHIADGTKTEGTIPSQSAQTITPGTSDQTIASGKYLSGAQTIKGDANLVAGNIAQGVTIFGVTGSHMGGTDVSDTTATASDVLSGKYFHTSDGTKTEGTIVGKTSSDVTTSDNVVTIPAGNYSAQVQKTVGTTQAAQTITPTTSDQTIASGKYLTGAQTIKGDANLVPSNIADGVTIFGVEGTHTGGGTVVAEDDVNFYDYDGTLVASYSASDFAQLTAMPDNPTHQGLTAQGWNWSLSNAKTYVANNGRLSIGQMYTTTSGSTEVDIIIRARLDTTVCLNINGTVTIDWGDNTTTDTVTGSSISSSTKETYHEYANSGSYTIVITPGENTQYRLIGDSTHAFLRKNGETSINYNKAYGGVVKCVRLGANASIGAYAFQYCANLEYVTLPYNTVITGNYIFSYCYVHKYITIPSGSNVTTLGSYAFVNNSHLKHVSIPLDITTINYYCFSTCYSLQRVEIPSNVTSLGTNLFYNCFALKEVVIPTSVTGLSTSFMFNNCYAIESISLPSSVTVIGSSFCYYGYSLANVQIPSNVTTINESAFRYCRNLSSITIPANVTSIGNNAFGDCQGLKEVRVLPATPPTAGTTIFSGLATDCIIYVPNGKLTTYQGESGWSTYASQMQEAPAS